MYRKPIFLITFVLLFSLVVSVAQAGISYSPPVGGWSYIYECGGDDGTWDNDNGSDSWDGSAIGAGLPGGISFLLDGPANYARIQDTGDPRDHPPNPGDPSNRKIYFTHALTQDIDATVADEILSSVGITLSFRARISTTPPLDNQYPNGGGASGPWPAGGDGYGTHNGGKANLGIQQFAGGRQSIGFCLVLANEELSNINSYTAGRQGLLMNAQNGTSPSDSVDAQDNEGNVKHVLELDPTEWHEFWITIEPDTSGGGTHLVSVYRDGSLVADEFNVTAGNDGDEDYSYIFMGMGSTDQSGAIDVDFFAYKEGIELPVSGGKASQPNPADGAIGVSVEANLTWVRGDGADEDEVYFGTDPCALPKVADILVLPSNPPLYNPGDPNLVASTTYYWRIDEVNDMNPFTGDLWSFTTVRGEAQPSYPFDGALIVGDIVSGNISTNLEFFPGATTVEYKGYFSEDYSKVATRHPDANLGPPPYGYLKGYEYTYWVGNPGVPPITDSLARGTKYYWTVDSNDAKGNTFYGDVWEFAIYGYYAFAPSPPNEAVLVSRDVLLSWLPGFSVEDHDVYMGTNWEDVNNAEYDPFNPPPEFLETRSEPNYQCIDLPGNTKLYWRVDEVVGRGPPLFIPTEFYKGNVWCFTTVPKFDIVDPNLVGWWKFDMGFGPTAWDWSGYDNHGTRIGDPPWVVGKTGQVDDFALDFDGISQYVDVPDSASLGLTKDFTIAAWIRPDDVSGGRGIVTKCEGTSHKQYVFTIADGELRLEYELSGNNYNLTGGTITSGDWQHVAVTVDSSLLVTLYVNAAVTASETAPGEVLAQINPVAIGRWSGTYESNYFDGLIDDVRIYNYPLSAAEIRMIGAPPEAWAPSPYDGEASVPVTTPLKWMPGKYAALHDVYLGTDKDVVTNATTSSAGIYKGRIGPNTLSVPLDAATLYYWRIDEVNLAGPDPYLWKGDTWMFRTVGAAGGLLGLYYHWDGQLPNDPLGPDNAFQIFVLDRIDPEVNFSWVDGSPDPNVNVDDFGCRWVGHVEAPVDANYTFYTTTDDGARLFIDGVKMPLVDPANPTNDSWRQQGDTEYSASIVLTAGLHDIEMHMYEHGGGATAQLRWSAVPLNPSDYPVYGLSTSRQIIPPIWLWPPLFASGPRPPNGATIEDRTPALEWISGVNAVYHELYFSANFDDVNDRNPAVKEIWGDPCRPYPAVPSLRLATTYYWCVDEVKSVSERWDARTVWSFTIAECLSLDNMEDYNDRGELRQVWRDGNTDVVWTGTYPYLTLAQGGSSGSNLNVSTAVGGYDAAGAPSTGPVPPTPLNYEAMVLRYDNDGFTYTGLPGEEKWVYDAPYYSEIEANTVGDNSLDVGQTWDSEGVKSLSLSFQGHPISDGYYDPLLWPTYTQYGRGRDIWGRHDEFFYLSKYPLIGAGSVQVQVLSVDNTNPWAKAGVMIREKWTPYSKFAAVFMTPGNGVAFQYRVNEDGPAVTVTKPGVTAPQYVRLVRNISGTFEAKYSANGFVWDDVNAPNAEPVYPEITMGTIADPNIYVGTAVTSHNANQICAADFNDLLLSPLPANWVFGNIGTNDPEQLYVALSDGVNTSVVEHNDVNAATLTTWQEWNIKLSDFTSVNLDALKKVYIGLGDRDVPVQGGSGAIYVDDIRACPPRCVPAFAQMIGDIAQPYDCTVDEKDIRVLAADWLLEDDFIASVAPDSGRMVAYWPLDTDYSDYSGNGYHGAPVGGASLINDADRGGVLSLVSDGDYVNCGNPTDPCALDFGTGDWTVSAWVKTTMAGTGGDGDKGVIYGKGGDQGGGHRYGLYVNENQDPAGRVTLITDNDVTKVMVDSTVIASDGEWHHVAGLRYVNDLHLYVDGLPDGSATLPAGYDLSGTHQHNAYIGGITAHGDDPNGTIVYKYLQGSVDDVQVYSYALSEGEVVYLATDGGAGIHTPINSPADLYKGEAPGNQWINFKDYALIADEYLEKLLWPTTP